MRRSTAILASVLALLLLCAGVFWFGGRLQVAVQVVTAPASEHQKAVRSIQSLYRQGTLPLMFLSEMPGDLTQCTLEDVTLTLTNPGLLDAEWLYIQPEAAPGDIAVYALSGEGEPVPARGQFTANLKLLTTGGGTRRYKIQYYVYGIKREILVTAP